MEQSPPVKLVVAQLVKKFPALHGTKKCITTFKRTYQRTL